jgi:hypothetical protein
MYSQYRKYCKQIGSLLHGEALEALNSGESSHLGLGLGLYPLIEASKMRHGVEEQL